MKKTAKRVSDILRLVFGYGMVIALFAGGLTFFGYLAALLIGGEAAAAICVFIYKTIIPVIIKMTTSLILLGLFVMYLSGETALTAGKSKPAKKK